MKTKIKANPREFVVSGIAMKDYGKIELNPNEMVSMVSQSGRECDFTAMDWGFYLAPSINGRLRDQGFKVALVLNPSGKLFINAVEVDKMDVFKEYLEISQSGTVVCWLDEWAS